MPTLATPANMRAFRETNPDGRRCFAVSLNDPDERSSADAGDYFMLPDDHALTDSYGDPMVLALERTIIVDAMSTEVVA
jgi:hypothetical protein